ncbi:hypothetical protein WR25_19824 isoform A [Diploscapter pachys]|uniref:Uncharacterized protein n=1 Tax=Diploscapter pachys TaxID=2018661 RepID=A0A2A2LAR3_9BILA|nr:hypothetical protein WR25_19824 isoform A [Diploscapter pachys]
MSHFQFDFCSLFSFPTFLFLHFPFLFIYFSVTTTMLRNSTRTGIVFKTFTQEESQFFSAIVLGLDHANRQAEGSLLGYSLMAVNNTALAASINDDSVTMNADQRRHRMGSLSSELVPGRVILWIEPDDLDEQGNIQFFEKYDTPFPEYQMDGDQILMPGAVHPNGDRFWTATFGYLQIDPDQCKDASPDTCYNAVINLEFSQEARSLKATFVCLYSLYEGTFDPHSLPWSKIPNLYKWMKAREVETKSKLPGPSDYDTEDSDDETVYKFTGIAVSDISLFGISKVPLEVKHRKLIRFVVTDPRHRLKVGYKYRFNAVTTEDKYIWNVTDCARMSGFREMLTPGGHIKAHVRKIYYSNGVFRNGTEMGDKGYGIMDDPLNLVREHIAHDHRPDAEAKVGIMDTPFNKNDKTIFRFRIVELFNDGRLQLFSKRAPILHKALFGVVVGKRVIFAPEIDGYLVNIRPEFRHEPAIGSLVVCKPDWDNERRKYYTVNVQLMHATRLQTVYKPVFRESDQLAYAFRVRGRPSPAFSGFFTCHHFGLLENRYDLSYEIKENEK